MKAIVRLIRRLPFGNTLIGRVKDIRAARMTRIQRRHSRRRGSARHYYQWHSPAFVDEQYAVLRGIAMRRSGDSLASGASYDLRRAVHRLEKGLIMKPRREVFATSYIGKAIEALEIVRDAQRDPDEVVWATGVLGEYFSVVRPGLNQEVDDARRRFETLGLRTSPALGDEDLPRPRERGTTVSPVQPDDLLKLFRQRRSVRWFLPDEVPREIIDAAIIAAREAPSACNRLPYRYVIVDRDPLRARVASIPGGTVGFAHNFPVIVAVVGELRAFEFERDRHLIYIDSSLSAMQFLLALQSHGVSSCVVNWPDLPDKNREIQPLLGLKDHERVVMMVAMGYADPTGAVPSSVKKPLAIVREYPVG